MHNNPLSNTGSINTMYMVSFLITLIFAALLLQIGSPVFYINTLMLIFVVSSYLFAGFVASTMSLREFQHGDRKGQSSSVAMALASGIIASGIFVTLAGSFFAEGTDAMAVFWGWLLGIAFMTILFSAGVTRSSKTTLPELISENGSSKSLRLLSATALLGSGTLLALSQLVFLGQVGEQFLGIPKTAVVQASSLAIGICLIISGIQGATVMRAVVYPVLLLVFMAPVVWVAVNTSGVIIPQLAFGTGALQPVSDINQEVLDAGLATSNEIFNFAKDSAGLDSFNYFATLICIGCAIAAMPHLLQHFKMMETGRQARKTGFFTFGLVFLFLSAVPAVAAFVQVDIYTSILGLQLSELQTDAAWVFDLSGAGSLPLIKLCGVIVADTSQAIAACGGNPEYFISVADISVNPELLTLSQGILHQTPELLTIILATGALLAIMTTLDGIVFSMGLSITNDGYQRFLRPKSPKSVYLFMCRFFIILVLVILTLSAVFFEPDPKLSFEMAMAFTAATLFTSLFIKLWLPATGERVRLCALLLSFLFCSGALWWANFGPDFIIGTGDEMKFQIPGITHQVSNYGIGLLGMIISFLVIAIGNLVQNRKVTSMGEETTNAAT